ncbi:hypothetical protein ACJU26_09005 [Acidithiobacillus sp. M4-SHS-6]|uniref:hypothetical protein n=1 Tax=Acidithiobacillus sp. M4-SHS-6 TaxID=3383024 RepID=UPI0039BDC6D6
MRDALLKSFIRIVLIWFTLLFVYWGVSDARIGHTIQLLLHKAVLVTPLNAIAWLWYVVYHWTLPWLLVSLVLFVVAYQATHLWHWRKRVQTARGADADAPWRGMRVTLGYLPKPVWEMREPEQDFDWGAFRDRAAELPQAHREVLEQTLSVLSAYPAGTVYVGPGHTDSLLEHTLHVLEPLWMASSGRDPLLPLLAAAHDMGKIRAWKKVDLPDGGFTWKRVGWHDDWSARLFSGLPSYWKLPDEDKLLALLALRYGHKFSQAPLLPIQQTQRLVRLHELLEGADREATAEEKKAVIAANAENMPEYLTRAFLDAITESLTFYVPGLPKGRKASVWRRKSRIYISEPALREAVLQHLPEDVAAAIESSRKPREVSPVTQALFEALRVQGWLVEALPEPGTRPESDGPVPLMIARPPLWNIRSGNINLNGVLIVNIPVEEQYRLHGECPVPILTLCPLYDSSGRVINAKNIFVPTEFLQASEAENGQPMKAMEDAEALQQDTPSQKETANNADPETIGEPTHLSPKPEPEKKEELSAAGKHLGMMGLTPDSGTSRYHKKKHPTPPRRKMSDNVGTPAESTSGTTQFSDSSNGSR